MGRAIWELEVSQFKTTGSVVVFWSFWMSFLFTDCFGKPGKDIPPDQCSFDEVYPIADIHWFQGDVNLTDGTETKQSVDDKGYFTVQSRAPTKKGTQTLPYNCSLWMPSLNTYISSRLVSSGSTAQLQWICIIMGILMKIIIM